MIKNIKLFVNNNDKSYKVAKEVEDRFIKNGFTISNSNFDLGIAIGGDGSFLRMIKSCCFSNEPYYVGINSGTLGFLQEVKIQELEKFIEELISESYKIENIGIQETVIKHKEGLSRFCSLNEILIRDKNLKLSKFGIYIDGDLFEKFAGDGIMIATSLGSTAHNLSYGGSIVYSDFSTLQITPIGPINSSSYRTLPNSLIVPTSKEIVVKPLDGINNLMVTIDGENNIYEEVEDINTSIKDKKIKCLRFSHYNFPQKINEKLLSSNN